MLVNDAAVGSIDLDIKTRLQICKDSYINRLAVVTAAFKSLLLKAQKP